MSDMQGYLVAILRWLEDATALGENVATIIHTYSGSAEGLLLHTSSETSIYLNIDEDNRRKAALAIIPTGGLDQGVLSIIVYKPSTHQLDTSLEFWRGEDEFNYIVETQDAQKPVFVVDDPHATYSAKEHSQVGEEVSRLLSAAVASLNTNGNLYTALTKLLAESVKEIIEDEIATSFGN